jgi:hypothetical protein
MRKWRQAKDTLYSLEVEERRGNEKWKGEGVRLVS